MDGFLLKVQSAIRTCLELRTLTVELDDIEAAYHEELKRELARTARWMDGWRDYQLELVFVSLSDSSSYC
jgi:hypothetical protein